MPRKNDAAPEEKEEQQNEVHEYDEGARLYHFPFIN